MLFTFFTGFDPYSFQLVGKSEGCNLLKALYCASGNYNHICRCNRRNKALREGESGGGSGFSLGGMGKILKRVKDDSGEAFRWQAVCRCGGKAVGVGGGCSK